MNYTVIGNDGQKYGPVSAAQIREWLRQGRADSRTAVFVVGATDWTFLGLLPEFANEFSGTPPVIGATNLRTSTGTNYFAIWGMICGLLAWTFCGCCLPFAIVGLTLSIIALVQVQNSAQDGRGFAIAGIVLSATNLLWTFAWTLAGILSDPTQVQWHVGN
jgi:Domain of unknown function (DUF4190)/GYF domain 2